MEATLTSVHYYPVTLFGPFDFCQSSRSSNILSPIVVHPRCEALQVAPNLLRALTSTLADKCTKDISTLLVRLGLHRRAQSTMSNATSLTQ